MTVDGRHMRLATFVLLVGCSAPSPSATPYSSEVEESATPEASPSIQAPSESPWLLSGTIDQQFTTPALEYRSTGTYLLWSSGARAAAGADVAPDLFGSEPGGPVRLLYDNPNRDSRLELVGGEASKFVFVEVNARAFGLGAWKMWYLSSPDAAPLLVDEGGGVLPFFAVSEGRLVWTVAAGDPTLSQLWLLDLDTMERRLLLSSDPAQAQYWFPAIDGSLVVFGTVELAPDGLSDERHVYLLDIDGDMTPRRLDASESASQPAILGDTVVWKESTPLENFLVGGNLVRYTLSTADIEQLSLDPSRARYTFPTVGGGYAAAWSDNDRALYLVDMGTGIPVQILDLGPTSDDPHDAVVRPDLADNLLAYVFGPANGDLELRWVVLR